MVTKAARKRVVRNSGKRTKNSPVASCSQHRKRKKKLRPAKGSKGTASESETVEASEMCQQSCPRKVKKVLSTCRAERRRKRGLKQPGCEMFAAPVRTQKTKLLKQPGSELFAAPKKEEGERKKNKQNAASESAERSRQRNAKGVERRCQRQRRKMLPANCGEVTARKHGEKEKEKRKCQRNASKDAASERRRLLLPAKKIKKLPAKCVERCCR